MGPGFGLTLSNDLKVEFYMKKLCIKLTFYHGGQISYTEPCAFAPLCVSGIRL